MFGSVFNIDKKCFNYRYKPKKVFPLGRTDLIDESESK